LLMDSKPKSDESSIDAALRAHIAELAKARGKTVEQFLGETSMQEIEKIATSATLSALKKMAGQGMASKLADAAAMAKMRDTADYLRRNRYNNFGPMIIADDDEASSEQSADDMACSDAAVFAMRLARYAR
jgi:hypothetical protein